MLQGTKLLVPVVVLALISGCSAGVADPEESVDPVADYPEEIAPVINAETGEAFSGAGRFSPSYFDANNLSNAVQHATQTCMVAHGYSGDQTRWGPADEVTKIRSSVGVWRVSDAERWAFATPMPPADMMLNSIGDSTLSESDKAAAQAELDSMKERVAASKANQDSDAYRTARDECAGDSEVKKWTEREKSVWNAFGGAWSEALGAAAVRAYDDPRVKTIGSEYDECLADADLRPQDPDNRTYDSFFDVEGQNFQVIDEQQISMALAVVDCKLKGDLVERLLSIIAEYQAPVYTKYQAELDDCAGELAKLRQEVAEYWAGNAS